MKLHSALASVVGQDHVLIGSQTEGYAVDWTRRFRGSTPAVVRPGNTAEVSRVLEICSAEGVAVVPQGGNTGLVGGGVPLGGEVVLSLRRMTRLDGFDREGMQVTAEAGVTLQGVADVDAELDFGVMIASRQSATVGGAIATNAGGVRVLRYGAMRAQIRGIEAVLSDGTVLEHLAGLVKDNTGYDYPSLLAGSEGTLAVITKARLRLVPRERDVVVAVLGFEEPANAYAVAVEAKRRVAGLVSAEFFSQKGVDLLVANARMGQVLRSPAQFYLLLEACGQGAFEELAEVAGDHPAAVGRDVGDRARLWEFRERQPEAAGFVASPIKLDVSVPSGRWVELTCRVASVVAKVDADATVITFGHIVDGNLHVNIAPYGATDGRHEEAVFALIAELGGSISAEHGIGALKARWLGLARSSAEIALFRRIRSAFDPRGILNPGVLPR